MKCEDSWLEAWVRENDESIRRGEEIVGERFAGIDARNEALETLLIEVLTTLDKEKWNAITNRFKSIVDDNIDNHMSDTNTEAGKILAKSLTRRVA